MELLKVSDNGHYLVTESGRPFFWLGDTTWTIVTRTDPDSLERFLENRSAKGFNVIQLVAISTWGPTEKNYAGEVPFHDMDVTRPNDAYFSYLDLIIERCETHGIYALILPVWGNIVRSGAGCVRTESEGLFADSEKLNRHCAWLAKRYGDRSNVMWALGGDVDPAGLVDTWRGAAEALRSNMQRRQLITYHPDWAQNGGKSSTLLHYEDWLDFNMIQSSHMEREHNYTFVLDDWHIRPPKPSFDAEPPYENIYFDLEPDTPPFTADDIRRFQYTAVFAGGFGATYGCIDICNFWDGHRQERPFCAPIVWTDSLDLPGSFQMQYLKSLISSRPMLSRIPDQGLLAGTAEHYKTRQQATRDSDGSWAMIYSASHRDFTVDLSSLAVGTKVIWWFDPRDGSSTRGGDISDDGLVQVSPPDATEPHDWVLVIDLEERGYPQPGSVT